MKGKKTSQENLIVVDGIPTWIIQENTPSGYSRLNVRSTIKTKLIKSDLGQEFTTETI